MISMTMPHECNCSCFYFSQVFAAGGRFLVVLWLTDVFVDAGVVLYIYRTPKSLSNAISRRCSPPPAVFLLCFDVGC
jgi:hypothetical protein